VRRITLLLVALALAGCSYTVLDDYTPPAPSATETTTSNATPSLTATASHTPTQTATAVPTETMTPTPTHDFDATPTQNTTFTPGIIEVTQIGGYPTISAGQKFSDLEGDYMPFGVLNIRVCADVSSGCAAVGQLSGNVAVRVYGMIVVYPRGDLWLCIDEPPAQYVSTQCDRVVAYVITGNEYGNLVLD